jgi:endonuclease/exonuclease/phosphatase family metal-dependent hydrolase
MPFYPKLKYSRSLKPEEKTRTANHLLELKEQLNAELPPKDLDQHLLLATWNIRDLAKSGPKHGERTLEDLFYIAEILSAFDLVAVQEVNDLDEWEQIMGILGRDWDYIATDVSEWTDGGNGERMTFLYDSRNVRFDNIAGEIVLSRTNLITENAEHNKDASIPEGRQFARTPFIVSFQAGWFKFDVCTVHIYFGSESGDKLERRIQEIESIAGEVAERAEQTLKNKHCIFLLGDFNIVHPEHQTMQALKQHGFTIPDPLDRPTNLGDDKYYDQIAIKANNDELLNFLNSQQEGKPNAGVFEMFRRVMNGHDWDKYKDRMKQTRQGSELSTDDEFKKYFRTWKTYRISDHKPLWVRIPIDRSREYLEDLL